MIEVTPNIKNRFPKAFYKARHEKIRAVRLSPSLWYCRRLAPNHGEYLIRLHVIPSVSGTDQVKAECRSVDGPRCKGTFGDKDIPYKCCTHIAKILSRAIQYGRKQQKAEAA